MQLETVRFLSNPLDFAKVFPRKAHGCFGFLDGMSENEAVKTER